MRGLDGKGAIVTGGLGAACENQTIAHRFVNGFDDPRDYQAWFMTPDAAERYLAEVSVPA